MPVHCKCSSVSDQMLGFCKSGPKKRLDNNISFKMFNKTLEKQEEGWSQTRTRAPNLRNSRSSFTGSGRG